jgi:hypothetical protein
MAPPHGARRPLLDDGNEKAAWQGGSVTNETMNNKQKLESR